jgi:hypothetical protein
MKRDDSLAPRIIIPTKHHDPYSEPKKLRRSAAVIITKWRRDKTRNLFLIHRFFDLGMEREETMKLLLLASHLSSSSTLNRRSSSVS